MIMHHHHHHCRRFVYFSLFPSPLSPSLLSVVSLFCCLIRFVAFVVSHPAIVVASVLSHLSPHLYPSLVSHLHFITPVHLHSWSSSDELNPSRFQLP